MPTDDQTIQTEADEIRSTFPPELPVSIRGADIECRWSVDGYAYDPAGFLLDSVVERLNRESSYLRNIPRFQGRISTDRSTCQFRIPMKSAGCMAVMELTLPTSAHDWRGHQPIAFTIDMEAMTFFVVRGPTETEH